MDEALSAWPARDRSSPRSFSLVRSIWSAAFIVSALTLSACDGTQPVSVTLEDFRFVPEKIHVTTESPLAVSLYNAGREPHEFDSPVLLYASAAPTGSTGILLQPGQSVRFVVAPPAGTYVYICRRKGHANMTGTLIVD